jgi:hypothetical protein
LLIDRDLEHQVTIIHRECCCDLPPLPPERRRLERHVLDHKERRLAGHRWRYDSERIAYANLCVGLIAWARLFGDPKAVSHVVPEVIKFPVAPALSHNGAAPS